MWWWIISGIIWLICSVWTYLIIRSQCRQGGEWTYLDRYVVIMIGLVSGPFLILGYYPVCGIAWIIDTANRPANW